MSFRVRIARCAVPLLLALTSCQDQPGVTEAVKELNPQMAASTAAAAAPGSEEFASRGEVRIGYIWGRDGRPQRVTYEVHEGLAIRQGDIVLGRAGEIATTVQQLDPTAQGSVINAASSRWPGGVIPYEIDPALPNQQRITDAIAMIHSSTRGVSVVPRTGQADYVRFMPSTGCNSYIGRIGGPQTINLSDSCTAGNTAHEILHALGMYHEQSRCDRDTFVQINFANIQPGREHNFDNECSTASDVDVYAEGSIMHYGRFGFSKNGLPTITSLRGLDHLMGQRSGLGATDIKTLESLYFRELTAEANGPYSGREGDAIAFSSAGSLDPGGGTLTYQWSFGDGLTSTAANPSKKYADNGTYKVKLTVRNAAGEIRTDSTVATITNVAPTGTFSVTAAPPSATAQETTDTGAEGEEAGAGESETAEGDATTARSYPIKYVPEGSAYTLKLVGSDVGTKDKLLLQYALDCGRGAGYTAWSSTNIAKCSAFPNQASTLVKAKVKDKDGGEAEYVIDLRITNAAPVVTLSATTGTTIPVGGRVSFQGKFTDAAANDNPWSYSASWGDGTAATTGTAVTQGGTIPLSHTFSTAGIFKVQLAVRDKDGGIGKSSQVVVTVSAVADGLIARYSFDGCSALDDTGKGNNGTLYGPACATGVHGKALRFDGINDYVQTPVSSNRHPMTISVVFSAARTDGERSIVDSDSYGYSGHSIIVGYGDGDGSLDVQYHNGTYDSPFPVAANKWHHAVAVIESTRVTLYVNGKLIGSTPYTAHLPLDGTDFRIGRHNAWDPQWFQGLVDDVRIFDRALTQKEVEKLLLEVGVPTT